ncbi:ABC transporter substrate-binding protein [Cellulomonas aerilata]|uniref:Bicyclomycin resistance protein n=1 Tax=Cellulomonas aerilata TaxID=515326 RepID=A0A512DDC4_9CELL|nr:extracellular solute-binding protein [Cellulomonas aerilata]GEO34210.1 bicyclomycin resistance protein [Cellulomonas aerilata]
MTRTRRRTLAAAGLVAVTALAACSGGGDDGGGDGGDGTDEAGGSITLWIQEDLPDRVAATQAIVDEFTAASGVEVELIPVAEDQFDQLLTSSAAAGDLPDVIGGISLPQVRTLSANELVDTDAVGAVLEELGADTFAESAIELTSDGDTQLAIPSESWLQLLVYRTDLFEAAGLDAPTSYEAVLAAAEALHSPEVAGFVGATAPGDAFTEQTFEHVALGNGCQLVDEEGEIQLDSAECVEALDFYGNLIQNYSVPGAQDVDTVRATYFAGQAAMFIWSSFILDEMAGLRDEALPSCAECAADPAFLAKNSAVVTALEGPGGSEPAQFGEITSWTVTAGADSEPAQQLIQYMLSDGYLPWIEIAPEGKVPVRLGTSDNPTEYSDAWGDMEVGVDRKAPLSEFYGPEVLEELGTGPERIARWALPQGQGDLLGALQGEQPVATAVNDVTQGTPAEDAATEAAEAAREIQESVS